MILILATHFSTFSQKNDSISLKPFKVEVVESDTCFCWTLQQSKKIAKHIVKSETSDSLTIHYDFILSKKDTIILKQKRQLQLARSLMEDKENELILNEHINSNIIKEIKKNNTKRIVGTALFSCFVGFIISK